MTRMIFVNLPVTDVARATAFYEAIGFTKNEAFSNEQASGMVWSDAIHVMLLDHAFSPPSPTSASSTPVPSRACCCA